MKTESDFIEFVEKQKTIKSLKDLHIRQSQFQSLFNKGRTDKVILDFTYSKNFLISNMNLFEINR